MPVKLERALKRQATEKGLKGERKDAYVFGTLRKTGWKPNREKKMSVTQVKIIQLNKRLEDLIQFSGNPEDPTAGMFGGNDPGFLQKDIAENEPVSALQRLKLKVARLRGMGLFNY